MNFKKKLKRIRKKIRRRLEETRLWNKLFLDFYLDNRWTVRFRVLNFISGGVLLYDVCDAYRCLKRTHDYDVYDDCGVENEEYKRIHEDMRQWAIGFYSRKAERYLDKAMQQWSREK